MLGKLTPFLKFEVRTLSEKFQNVFGFKVYNLGECYLHEMHKILNI